MSSNKIDGKIQDFIKANPLVRGKSQEEILSIMADCGEITSAELLKISAFKKSGSENSDKGLVLEKKNVKPEAEAKLELSREDAQDGAIAEISANLDAAESLYKNQKNTQGDVSNIYDLYKEVTKDDLSRSRLEQAITLEKLGYTYLIQAKSNNLTKREYYEHVKEDLMLMTPGYNNLNSEAKAEYKARLDSLTLEEIKFFQKQLQSLPDKDAPDYNECASRYINNLKSMTEDAPKLERSGNVEIDGVNFKAKSSIKPPVKYSDGDELIKFEEVFAYERGTKFDKDKIARFETAKTSLQLAQSVSAKAAKVHKFLDSALVNPRGDWQASDYAKVETGLKLSLQELFGKDEAACQEGLKKLLGDEMPGTSIEISRALLTKLDENLAKVMNGKSIDDFKQEYADSFVEAFGRKNSEQLARAYVEDNESIDERISGGMQIGGMVVMGVGGALCLIPGGQIAGGTVISAGGKLAMTGLAAQTALGAWNESTKSGGMSDEAAERLTKEGLINLATFAVGAGAGIKGAQVRAALTAKGSGKFVSLAAERGTDLAISMAGDMILTGNLNVEGNMIGQLTAAITGLKTGKTIAKKSMNTGFAKDTPLTLKSGDNLFSEIISKHDNPEVKSILSDIEATIGTVKDEKLSAYLEASLKKLNQSSVSDAELRGTLLKAREVIDVYNTVNRNYSNIGEGAEHQEFIKFMEKLEPNRAEVIKKDASLKTKLLEKRADGNWTEDFKNHVKYSKLINFVKVTSDKKLADYLYSNYYLKTAGIPNSIKNRYLQINQKYNVKIFSSPLSNLDLKKTADAVEKELEEWSSASGSEAKLPPVIDFLGTKTIYYDVGAGGYAGEITHALGINGMNAIVDVNNFLRHEITHINDKKITGDINTDYSLPSEIAPKRMFTNPKTGKQDSTLDFANCKYRDEFLKAGVEPSHVRYAYTNSKEFIAVASEGDMGRYSPEFRELLIKMGMPEWQFKMRNFDKNADEYAKSAADCLKENPGKTLEEIIFHDKPSVSEKSSRPPEINNKLSSEQRDYNEAGGVELENKISGTSGEIISAEAVEESMRTPELYQRGFTEQRIESLMNSIKGNPQKITLLSRLLPLEHRQFDYSAIKNILDFDSNIPIEIIDKFIKLDDATLAARGAELSAYELSYLLRGLKTSDGKLIENYQEAADFAYKLLGKKSGEGAMSCPAICEVINNFGVDQKAADGIFEVMSIKGMGRTQVSPKDAVRLYVLSKDGRYSISQIKDVLKLTPEQLKVRGNRSFTASEVNAILTYAPDKADIIKDLVSLPSRDASHQESASSVAGVIADCGDDKQRISDIKRLLSMERPLKRFSNEARHLDVLLANSFTRNSFEGKIDTIEKLFLLEPKTSAEKWLPVDYFINSDNFIKNSKAVFDAAGDNYKNFSPQDIKIFAAPENVNNITSILRENPKLTPDEIRTKLSDLKLKELNPLVKDGELQSIAKYIYNEHNNVKNHPNWRLIEELEFKLTNVGDKQVQDYLKNTFNEIDDIMKSPVTASKRIDVIEKLKGIDKTLDVYHTIAGHYTYIGLKDKFLSDIPHTREFIDYVRKDYPQAAEEFSKYAVKQYGNQESLELKHITENIGKDFMRDLRIERLKEYAKENPDNPLANHFYEQYLLAFDSYAAKRCLDINKKYNTKIILSEIHDDYRTELDFIEGELNRWHDASTGTAVMPPVLDFSKCKKKWFDDKNGSYGPAAGYSELGTNKAVSVSGMHLDMLQDVIRHEMTHSNTDLTVLQNAYNKYDLNKIMPKKTITTVDGTVKQIPDFDNCKYKEEFLKAGIPPYHISYAYKDIYEFTAVASEGDMSKYSPEFKQLLKDFGMPEWQFKMDCVQPENITRAQNLVKITEQFPELRKYDELYAMEELYEINELLPDYKKWDVSKIKKQYAEIMIEAANGIPVQNYIEAMRESLDAHLCPMLSDGPDGKFLSAENEQFLRQKAAWLHKEGVNTRDNLVKALFEAGLGDEKSMSYRVKGEQSLFDKMKNYLFDNKDKEKCYFDAEQDVRDLFAARTIVESGNFEKHPDVVKLLQSGDTKGALLRAAELQSQPAVEKLKSLIDKQARGESDIELTRISNYKGADGIPYLSEAQLADIKQFAFERGIKLDFVTRIEPDDPMYGRIDTKAHNKKAATKVRDSGYTALQLNFKNKADGKIFEWQFRGDKVTVFAEAEHVPYDLRTGKDIISAHPELEPLYTPIKELLSKEAMTEEQFDNYNKYLTAHYEHLRKSELGFESTAPKLKDFGNFDKRLSAENLELLHDVSEKLKKGKLTQTQAVKLYNDTVASSNMKNIKPA